MTLLFFLLLVSLSSTLATPISQYSRPNSLLAISDVVEEALPVRSDMFLDPSRTVGVDSDQTFPASVGAPLEMKRGPFSQDDIVQDASDKEQFPRYGPTLGVVPSRQDVCEPASTPLIIRTPDLPTNNFAPDTSCRSQLEDYKPIPSPLPPLIPQCGSLTPLCCKGWIVPQKSGKGTHKHGELITVTDCIYCMPLDWNPLHDDDCYGICI